MDLDTLAFVAAHPDDPLVLLLVELRARLASLREAHAGLTSLILQAQSDVEEAWAELASLVASSAPQPPSQPPPPGTSGPSTAPR